MKKKVWCLLLCFPAHIVFGQDCRCPQITLAINDFDINAVKPSFYKGGKTTDYTLSQVGQIKDWQTASDFATGGFLAAAMKNTDRNEIRFIDLKVKKGDEDYLVAGEFVPAANGMLLNVHLEDARTREQFGQVSVSLSALSAAGDAGAGAAQKLSPLLKIIRDHQHRVRDQERRDETAIESSYELSTRQSSLKSGATTEIRLKLFDCDDHSPLKNRKVKLNVVNGKSTISPQTVTTDDKGEARATFKAASQSERAQVEPEYVYTNVTGKTVLGPHRCSPPLYVDVEGSYKLSVVFEVSGHSDHGEKSHAYVSGSTYVTIIKENNCYSVKPSDGNSIDFAVEELVIRGDNGNLVYQSPLTFTSPIRLEVSQCEGSPMLRLVFLSFGAPEEDYLASDGSHHKTASIVNALAMATLGSVHAGRMANNAVEMKQKMEQAKGTKEDLQAAAKRLQQHMREPGYMNSAQGKADLAAVSQVGSSLNYASSNNPSTGDPGPIQNLNTLYIDAPFAPETAKPVDKVQEDRIRQMADQKSGIDWDFGRFHVVIAKL